MATPTVRSTDKLFDIYVRMRLSGDTSDIVITQLQSLARSLSREDRIQVNHAIAQWETTKAASFGVKPAPIPTPEAPNVALPHFSTHFADSSKLSSLGLGSSVTNGNSYIPVNNAPKAIEIPQICPKCSKKNSPKELYCGSCGTVLKSTVSGTRRIEGQESRGSTAQFKDHARIFLQVRGFGHPLEIHVNEEMILGRAINDSPLKPNVDLSPYKAADLGVSRLHAVLRRDNGTITLTDLESSNFTYVNGQRLYPQETRVLRHGDEIRLGKLIMKVTFKR